MIKNDFRYIIKKILIGIGIFIGIFYFKSCSVNALEDTSNMTHVGYYSYNSNINVNIYYDSLQNRLLYVRKNSNNTYTEQSFIIPENFNYIIAIGPDVRWLNVVDSELYAEYSSNDNRYHYYCRTYPCHNYYLQFEPFTNNAFTSTYQTKNNNTEFGNYPTLPSVLNFDLYNQNKSQLIKQKNLDINLGIQDPEIISLNPTFNENENVLLSVTFSPEFSYIDTENYNYYAWFKGYDKLSILENNTVFNTQYNTTFYVEITDKEGNTIDSETFTVSRIGQYDVSEYQILFSYEYYTESDTVNESKPFDYINRVDIDTTFLPKSPYLKYQYQFVNEDDTLTDDWITINPENSSDLSNNEIVFTTYDNGTLYARILDLDGNFLYSSTYKITNIGNIKYYANDTNVGGFFDKIIDKLDYSGPISSLISIPIRLFSSLLSESSKTCTPYNFGTLLGSNITFSCVNVENYIGSNLYHLLDLLMSFGLALGIIHFVKKQYHKFTTLNDNSDDIM